MSVFREDVADSLPVLRALARVLTAGDHALADDLVQDTMVSALQAQGQFQPGTNLEAWLFTILRNRFRSLRNRRHVTAEVAIDDFESLATVPPAQEARLDLLAFRSAFRRLPRVQREMLVLVGVRGLPYEGAAELCGCVVGTAKSRVHRARAALRSMLLDDAPADHDVATPFALPGRGPAARAARARPPSPRV